MSLRPSPSHPETDRGPARQLAVCEHGHAICSICNGPGVADFELPWDLIDGPERDRGFMLTEILVAMVLIGLLLVPVSALIVTTLRASVQAERRATSSAMLQTAGSLVGRVPVVDPCVPGAFEDVLARVSVPVGYSLDVVPDCSAVPAVVAVTVVDPSGRESSLEVVAAEGGA